MFLNVIVLTSINIPFFLTCTLYVLILALGVGDGTIFRLYDVRSLFTTAVRPRAVGHSNKINIEKSQNRLSLVLMLSIIIIKVYMDNFISLHINKTDYVRAILSIVFTVNCFCFFASIRIKLESVKIVPVNNSVPYHCLFCFAVVFRTRYSTLPA